MGGAQKRSIKYDKMGLRKNQASTSTIWYITIDNPNIGTLNIGSEMMQPGDHTQHPTCKRNLGKRREEGAIWNAK
jgi:hypothetical protein